jgi:hypothetical protein
MRRRTLLPAAAALATAALATAALAGCTAATPATAPQATPTPSGVVTPSPSAAGTVRAASWALTGGFVGPGIDGIRPPRLVVYPDGRAIADAKYAGTVSAAELADLTSRLANDLRDPAVTSPRAGAPQVADAPDTVITVHGADGDRQVTVPALEELRDAHGYAAELYDARDRLDTIYQRVVNGGKRFTPDKVRVVAQAVDPNTGPAGAVQPWPAAVPVPPDAGNTRSVNLSGDAARNAASLLDANWRQYRIPNGVVLSATWRYLLPDE